MIEFNERNREREMPYFGQDLFLKSEQKGPLNSKEYLDALASNHQLSRAEGIDFIMDKFKLDALVAPTGGPAWITDLINGDHVAGGSSSAAAVAGYPNINVTAGYLWGLPVGISFFGRAWSEPTLLKIAYSFEQLTKARQKPRFLPTSGIAVVVNRFVDSGRCSIWRGASRRLAAERLRFVGSCENSDGAANNGSCSASGADGGCAGRIPLASTIDHRQSSSGPGVIPIFFVKGGCAERLGLGFEVIEEALHRNAAPPLPAPILWAAGITRARAATSAFSPGLRSSVRPMVISRISQSVPLNTSSCRLSS